MNENLPENGGYLFEVSWEVCNKVGGIHTVVGTKALTAISRYGDNYICIGPDFTSETKNIEFEEDPTLFRQWHQIAYNEGLRVRVGRWKAVKGNPIVILVDYSSFISQKDSILANFWEDYGVDSISGGWDYIEPFLFGYATAKVIENFKLHNIHTCESVIAHFHEWMTASGGLFIKKYVPGVATVFTTHATVAGRCIAGNGLPLYGNMAGYNGDEIARRFGVMAKHSIEKAAAHNYDVFATVSELTARECEILLSKRPNQVTPNGFEKDFVPKGGEYDKKRKEARATMINVAEVALDVKFEREPMIVAIGGRYEFKNKGIDEFIDAMAELNNSEEFAGEILAYIMVPSWNHGARGDLRRKLANPTTCVNDYGHIANSTHYLGDPDNDPVINHLRRHNLLGVSKKVKVIFVPCYLNGDDGIFNKSYYDLLIGADVSVFPSYYEPWGYTPLESIAFGVPTITTDLAGFGIWVKEFATKENCGVTVIHRDDYNYQQVTVDISKTLLAYANQPKGGMEAARLAAQATSDIALWSNLFSNYEKVYTMAKEKVAERQGEFITDGGEVHEQVNYVSQQLLPGNHPNWTRIMVERAIPEELHKLELLSKNLWWSWNESARQLFESLDPEMWNVVERNPIAQLDHLSLKTLREFAQDKIFLARMDSVYEEFETYMAQKGKGSGPKIAYFSMEYGLHASLKIYSGGLGILAGDYLKESSDKNVPMTAVGLLYRYGYFTQRLSNAGDQEAGYEAQNFDKLPITAVRDEQGNWKTITVNFPGRTVTARIWRCDVGRTELYLLDTDHDLNLPEDRSITYHLYGGDWDNRLKQELLLGIGGIRAMETLGVKSDVYHCNEGHAAFIGLERAKNFIYENELSFSEALEAVRSSSLFTTHTPVPAGHDAFDEGMIRQYMSHYPERLKITWEQFINLGKTNPHDPSEKFSMSVLAANLSQEVNGVSWLHGEVSKDIMANMWPGYFPCESHIGYVTNGVHFPTWAASRLKSVYHKYLGDAFFKGDYSKANWDKVYDIPDELLWDSRLYLKQRLMKLIRRRVADPAQFRFDSPRQLVQIQEALKGDVLTIGFARRFATYKRAHLLFTNLERLAAIVNNSERPVQFVFAGKAHPADKAGQDLIRRIVEVSKMPQFLGKIIFLQNYDMELARRMVQGVDIWLNTPTRPLEASGTSGEKAVMNGVMHFSVLDGWWVEGYKEGAGWMLPQEGTFTDQRYQDELDAEMVYSTIEEQIAPQYYARNSKGLSHEWVATIKRCIAEVASDFTTNRMMQDYEDRFYSKLYERHTAMVAGNFAMAREIASWKRNVSRRWDNVNILEVKTFDLSKEAFLMGQHYNLEVTLDIDGLKPEDIGVEIITADQITDYNKVVIRHKYQFEPVSVEGNIVKYRLENAPEITGTFDTAIRVYAHNCKLPHRQDFALVKWA